MVKKLRDISLYIIFAFLILGMFLIKADYHVDELLTYNLANSDHDLKYEDGIRYEPASTPFEENMASDGKIDLKRVWTQQTNDVHPPFYYVLVHLMSTLHPGVVSMRDAGMINLIFQLLTLFFIRKIVDILIPDSETFKNIISISYILSAGVLNIAAFLRMYSMAMCMATIFTYLILKGLEKTTLKYYIELYIITVIGALTHYYFIVYIFFAMAALSVILLCNRRFKDFIFHVLSVGACGGITSVVIFPAMTDHLFHGNRGSESLSNLTSASFSEKLKSYYELLNNALFGKTLTIILLLLIVAVIYVFIMWDRDKKCKVHFEKIEMERYCLIIIPSVMFVFMVSKMAPYIADRYVSIIFAIIICGTWCLLYKFADIVLVKDKSKEIVLGVLATCIVVSSALNSDWSILNLNVKAQNTFLSQYFRKSDAICVYNDEWRINTAYMAASNCDSSIFFKAANFDEYSEKSKDSEVEYGDRLVFFLSIDDTEGFIEQFVELHPEYHVESSFQWGYTTYCLTTEEWS